MLIKDGPLTGLDARAVFVVGKDGIVKHAEYVSDIATEPNYDGREVAHPRHPQHVVSVVPVDVVTNVLIW